MNLLLKWAGGKRQLLPELTKRLPVDFDRYIEPFVGGGALFFWVASNTDCQDFVLMDKNPDLINVYEQVSKETLELAKILREWEKEYRYLDLEHKKPIYYQRRRDFNANDNDPLLRAAQFIFLNKTCFNGLYRVNSKGEFNVPIGSYKAPKIYDEDALLFTRQALEDVSILCEDYTRAKDYATPSSLTYFDPPYMPISETANFVSYTSNGFNTEDQLRLRDQFRETSGYAMLSNSGCEFFDDEYHGFNIERVSAKRAINQGKPVQEVIIRNYG